MNKPVKIFVSILLVISIILNPFSSFIASATGVEGFIVTGFISYLISQACQTIGAMINAPGNSEAVGQIIADVHSNYVQALTSCDAINADYIYTVNPDGSVTYTITGFHYNDVSGSGNQELESVYAPLVSFLNDYLANGGDLSAVSSSVLFTDAPRFSMDDVRKIKEMYMNSIIADIYSNIGDLDSAIDLPTYSFDFVGPIPSITYPVGTDRVSLQKEGFLYTIPFSSYSEWYNGIDAYYYFYPSEEFADSAGCNFITLYYELDGKQWWNGSYQVDCYGGGIYILYNGECYYNCTKAYSAVSNSHTFPLSGFTKGAFIAYLSCDGVRLSDVYTGGSFSMGAVVNLTGQVEAGVPSEAVNDDEFNVTTGGNTIDVPRTDDENIIGAGISSGLVGADGLMTFDESGNITSVDGITLSKIEELIDLISTGNLAFEDVQQYLDVITTLVTNGNLTESEQLIVLGNLQSLIDSQSLSISEINTAVQSISESLTATGELILDSDLDIETPGISFIDKFPFCLPFDFYNILCLLCSQPKEPIFELPLKANFKNDYINYEIDEVIVLDLTIFRLNGVDMVRVFCNTCSILLFVICLISGTKKFIWK